MSIIVTVKGLKNVLKFVIGNTCDAISLTEPFPSGSFTLQATLLLILLSLCMIRESCLRGTEPTVGHGTYRCSPLRVDIVRPCKLETETLKSLKVLRAVSLPIGSCECTFSQFIYVLLYNPSTVDISGIDKNVKYYLSQTFTPSCLVSRLHLDLSFLSQKPRTAYLYSSS